MDHGAGRRTTTREPLEGPDDAFPDDFFQDAGSPYEPEERELLDDSTRLGLGSWAVPWSALMMVMFILFLVTR